MNKITWTGARVKALRLKTERSQFDFAGLVRVRPETVSRWERTEGELKLQDTKQAILDRIAAEFGFGGGETE